MQKMMTMHKLLEEKIQDRFHFNPSRRHDENVLALIVELSELANETKCFKYWSANQTPERERMLEEYADLHHCLMGLGNALHCKPYLPHRIQEETLTDQFLTMIDLAMKHHYIGQYTTWRKLMDAFSGLGFMLGFSPEEIESAYMKKHRLNMERQDEEY